MSSEGKEKYVMSEDEAYWAKRHWRWDEWGSPVGLGLGWALFIVPLGIFIELLHLAGLVK